MRAGGGDSGPAGGWMAPFAQALQGLRPSPAQAGDDATPKSKSKAATGPLTARRGGGNGSGELLVKKKGGATLRPEERKKTGVFSRGRRTDLRVVEEAEVDEEAAAGGVNKALLAAGVILPTLLAVGVALYQSGAYSSIQGVNIGEVFREVEEKVTELGPWGYALFAGIYILAEVRYGLGPSVRGVGDETVTDVINPPIDAQPLPRCWPCRPCR